MSRKGVAMTQNKPNKTNDDVIMVTDETGVQLYLSDKAANTLAWFFTGVIALLSLPVIILALVSC